MGIDVLLGLQWGDEGKGKIVDFLAPKYDVICRFQGGPNAGHTLEFDGIKHVLHQIPSGIFRDNIMNVIGNGVVLDPVTFQKEIEALAPYNLDLTSNLFISKRTQIILPTHRLLDAAQEQSKGAEKIGSTLRGIGPAYQDKIGRNGVRVGDLDDPSFEKHYQRLVDRHRWMLDRLEYEYSLDEAQVEFDQALDVLREFTFIDAEHVLNESLRDGKAILAEGAQGSLLDIDFGSYPYVTSSNTMAAGACTGLGIAPRNIHRVFGIFKAYCTRVGEGPFPTELEDATGTKLREVGKEFGATTGRPRRCGWLDLPALKYTTMLNGVDELFMMKADVLAGFDDINVCTHYLSPDGTEEQNLSFEAVKGNVTPVYQAFPTWPEIDRNSSFDELSGELLQYVEFIERSVEVPISVVSCGPDRTQTIHRSVQEKMSS